MKKLNTIIAVILIFAVSAFLAVSSIQNTETTITDNIENKTDTSEILTPQEDLENIKGTKIFVPAVDSNGNGVTTALSVEIENGTGRTLVDIDQLLFFVDTQFSIQTAKDVAVNKTNNDLSNYDLTYSIVSPARIIEGPSAGAGMTVATIAALEGKDIPKDVMITGTIEQDGSIGRVGGILQKAKASKAMGAEKFLVPSGQSIFEKSTPKTNCRVVAGFRICNTVVERETINISEEVGIKIVEVSDIDQVIDEFEL